MLLQRLDRYILKMATIAAIVLLIGLTSVIWVTQALREVDLITGKYVKQQLCYRYLPTQNELAAEKIAHLICNGETSFEKPFLTPD